jgi:hypothetical protein
MYNVGFRKNVTNDAVTHVMFQKSLPVGGYVAAGSITG